jgi:hypothetical protein
MNGQGNVFTAERALRALWNGDRRMDRDALFAPGFRFRNLGGSDDVTNLRGLRRRIARLRAAHPEGHLTLEDVFGSGDHFVAWWAFQTDGRTETIVPRSEAALLEGTCMLRLRSGQVAEMLELGGQLIEVS